MEKIDDELEMKLLTIKALYEKAQKMREPMPRALEKAGLERVLNKPDDRVLVHEVTEGFEHKKIYYAMAPDYRGPAILPSVRYDYASDLFAEAASLWHSLAELSKLAPDSVRETLRATAVEVSGRASKICDGLGVDTDMYAAADGNMARAKYSFHMASRLAGISGLMEYNNVELKDIKLAW